MTITNADGDAGGFPTGLQSVDRALQVLELLAVRGAARVSEVAAEVGVHKSSAFRLLGALEARDLVEQNGERGRYRLGFCLVKLARRVDVQLDLADHCRVPVERLAQQLGESVTVAVLQESYAVNIVQSRGRASVVSQNWLGQLTPLHATSSGKILLAHLESDARRVLTGQGLERYTPHTLVDATVLEPHLDGIRLSGSATTFGELEVGLNAVAVPVRSETGTVIAALSASGPAYRVSPERIVEIVAELKTTSLELTRRMGYWGDTD